MNIPQGVLDAVNVVRNTTERINKIPAQVGKYASETLLYDPNTKRVLPMSPFHDFYDYETTKDPEIKKRALSNLGTGLMMAGVTESVDKIPKKIIDLNKQAIKKYGLTDIDEGIGYITPEGKGIDSSGLKMGSGNPYVRTIDHREIAQEAYPDNFSFSSSTDAMNQFMNETGNIRVVGAKDSLNIEVPIESKGITNKQINRLKKMAQGKKVYYDFSGKDGKIIGSGEGDFNSFYSDFKSTLLKENNIKQDIKNGNISKQLHPLKDLIKNNNLSFEESQDALFNNKNPLHDSMIKQFITIFDKNKTWSDYGFDNFRDFYNKLR